jgi:hypothetical protein
MNTHPKWTHAYRLNALALNPDLIEKVDREIAEDFAPATVDVLSTHWIFSDQIYSKAVADLVQAARKGPLTAPASDSMSDHQLAAHLLKDGGLWDAQKPRSLWEKTRFLSRFLFNYSATFVRARRLPSHERLSTRQRGHSASIPN